MMIKEREERSTGECGVVSQRQERLSKRLEDRGRVGPAIDFHFRRRKTLFHSYEGEIPSSIICPCILPPVYGALGSRKRGYLTF